MPPATTSQVGRSECWLQRISPMVALDATTRPTRSQFRLAPRLGGTSTEYMAGRAATMSAASVNEWRPAKKRGISLRRRAPHRPPCGPLRNRSSPLDKASGLPDTQRIRQPQPLQKDLQRRRRSRPRVHYGSKVKCFLSGEVSPGSAFDSQTDTEPKPKWVN
jgi:hypothetical protein